ncbi:ubiquitin thioesterase otulin isoform X3 [Myotis myotis]|uniref:ubiquitin thioesterase otulin isoform X3 n=1 Tax=Myotis myotis TaxID=51298 RepID=UPI0017495271|nr:ubiquitin thioesterase otulin isoform X3 [Myotis myotis]
MSRGTMPQPGAWLGASCAEKLAREAGAVSPGPGRAAALESGKAAAGGQPRAAVRCPAEHSRHIEIPLNSQIEESIQITGLTDNSIGRQAEFGSEEDMYRAADEIEKEKELLIHERGLSEPKLSVAPEMDIMDYCKKEWRGNTQKATCMKKGYEEVSQKFTSIRRVRGDNYCALRATLFQAMSQPAGLPSWLQDPELTLLPEKLISKYSWIKQWKLGLKFEGKSEDLVDKIKESLTLLRKKWAGLAELRTAEARQKACDELFTNEEEEYSLYEAVKFLMLHRAIELYDDKEKGEDVPFFSVLLFARDTSSDPGQLLRNHLNQVGHTGGLEQIEMFLLAYAVRHTIQVYRLSKYSTEEFITVYPTDPPRDWPVVTLIAEDDRHYNIPVRVCEETSL